MRNNDEARKLAEMLDRLCAEGTAHINVAGRETPEGGENDNNDITVKTVNSTACCTGNMACNVPTIHKGIDDDEEEK